MSAFPSPQLASRLPTTPGRFGGEPPTSADNNLRSRSSGSRFGEAEHPSGDASPTSTTLSNSRSLFGRPSIPLSSSSALTANFDTTQRKISIRADPALVTCFDPSDKELYDLWAPKR